MAFAVSLDAAEADWAGVVSQSLGGLKMADDFGYDSRPELVEEALFIPPCGSPLDRLLEAIELIKEASPELWQQLRAEAPAMPMQLLEAAEAATVAEREQRRWERGVATLKGGKISGIPEGF